MPLVEPWFFWIPKKHQNISEIKPNFRMDHKEGQIQGTAFIAPCVFNLVPLLLILF